MGIEKIIKQVLKEEFTSQMCQSPEVNKKFKEFKIYRLGYCRKLVFDSELKKIKDIQKETGNVIQKGPYKGGNKSEVLKKLNDNYNQRLNEKCGGVIFMGKEPDLDRTPGVDPCKIPSVINDYKNPNVRRSYNKYMGYPENEDIFSGGPISPMI
jgi:hypothetical protein